MSTSNLFKNSYLQTICLKIIYFIKKKQQTGRFRIINLFPSCYAFLKNSKTRKKKLTGLLQILWIKSNQNRQRKEGGRG